jgi:hypothetical protein
MKSLANSGSPAIWYLRQAFIKKSKIMNIFEIIGLIFGALSAITFVIIFFASRNAVLDPQDLQENKI